MFLSKSQVIKKIKESNNSEFHIDFSRTKNRETAYNYNLRIKDIIDIIKQVENIHYFEFVKCEDKKFNIDYWYIFKVSKILKDLNGDDKIVSLYIRLGFCDGKIKVYVRSFHEDDEC